jgi:hypothetical protein
MLKWLLTLLGAPVELTPASPWLWKFGLGRQLRNSGRLGYTSMLSKFAKAEP